LLTSVIREFYSALITSLIICLVICRVNRDLKKVPLISYALSSLSIASTVTLINLLMPDLNVGIKWICFSLVAVFVVMTFYRHNMYYTAISAVFSVLIVGLGSLLVALAYAYPLGLSMNQLKDSFVHTTFLGLSEFVFSCVIMRLMADDFMKARKRIYKKHKKFMILLCGNLITAFVILLFVFSLLNYAIEFRAAIEESRTVYVSAIFVVAVLISSIIGTIYLINYFLLNKIKYDRLKTNTLKDLMTGTLNRGSGLKFIEEQIELCKTQKRSMTICYIDVNDLKVINDMLGHREGDFLIKTITGTIKKNIRETDVISRLGGDEFVIVFPGCTMEYSEKLMNRISGELRQLKPFTNKDYTISISYGFSEYDGELEITVDGLLDEADRQMYQNKRAIKAMA